MKSTVTAVFAAMFLPLLFATTPAVASPSRDACAGRFIDAVPTVITSPGTWCLRKDLATAIASGAAITIDTANVTLDCNGHQLSGLAAGRASQAVGIRVEIAEYPGFQDAVIRNCHVRGFFSGIEAYSSSLVEDNRVEGSIVGGIFMTGVGAMRRNVVVDTGGVDVAHAAAIGVFGHVDMLDNTVDGVIAGTLESGYSQAIGMSVRQSTGISVRGNRVRGIHGIQSASTYGIVVRFEQNDRILVADNQVSLLGTGYGIHCPDESIGFVRDNVVHGATTEIESCQDLGGNEVLP